MYERSLRINGEPRQTNFQDRTSLAHAIREQGLTGTKVGCEQGVCGSCNVLINGDVARSCLTLAASCADRDDIITIEGIDGRLVDLVRDAMHQEHGLQCGFCTPGMVIAIWDLVGRGAAKDETSVREALASNLCRCTGYSGLVRAALRVAAELEAPSVVHSDSTDAAPEHQEGPTT